MHKTSLHKTNFSDTLKLRYLEGRKKKKRDENRKKRNIHKSSLRAHQQTGGRHNQAATSPTTCKLLHIWLLSHGLLLAWTEDLKAGLQSGVKQLLGTSGLKRGDLKLDQCRISKVGLKKLRWSSDFTKHFILFYVKEMFRYKLSLYLWNSKKATGFAAPLPETTLRTPQIAAYNLFTWIWDKQLHICQHYQYNLFFFFNTYVKAQALQACQKR